RTQNFNISDLFFSFQSSNDVYNAPFDITKKLNVEICDFLLKNHREYFDFSENQNINLPNFQLLKQLFHMIGAVLFIYF
ncbi:hypothetical protein BpHYR1_046434, partial [Brachionus plicatilis]